MGAVRTAGGGNLRNVWKLPPSKGFKGAHFATFPPELVEPCILAGTSQYGVCRSCGAPYVRETTRTGIDLSRPQTQRAMEIARESGLTDEHLQAVAACGITDVGKAAVVQTGTGRNRDELKMLAAEAKEVLGGYYREFTMLRPQTQGWRATCECCMPTTTATVLDPFAGAGTVGLVAQKLGRDSTLIEISPKYAAMAAERIRTAAEDAKVEIRWT